MPAKFVLKKGTTGTFRFSLVSTNGNVMARSEAYKSKAAALGGVRAIRRVATDAAIEDQTTKDWAEAERSRRDALAARRAATVAKKRAAAKRAEPTKAASPKAGPTKAPKAEPTKAEPTKAEPTKAEPAAERVAAAEAPTASAATARRRRRRASVPAPAPAPAVPATPTSPETVEALPNRAKKNPGASAWDSLGRRS